MKTRVNTDEERVREREVLRHRIAALEQENERQRKSAQETVETLREVEELFALVTGNSPDQVFLQDRELRYVWVSRENWLGFTGDQIGKTDQVLFDSEEKSRHIMEIKRKIIESGKGMRLMEETAIAGKVRYYDVALEPWRDRRGNILGIMGNVRDITEHKRNEQSLNESRAKLQSIFDSSPDAIAVSDLEGKITDVNAAMSRMFGYSRDQLIGKQAVELFSESDRKNARQRIREYLKQGSVKHLEYTMPTADGRSFNADIAVSAVKDDKGHAVSLMTVISDITERKQAEEALKESERRLSTLMSNLPGMVYRCRNDREWSMLFVSQGSTALTGYRPEDLTGNKVQYGSLIHPDDREKVWSDIQAALRERRAFQVTYRITIATGEEKWVWEQGRGVFASGGALLAIEGVINDITERKNADDALRASEKKYRMLFHNMPDGFVFNKILTDDKGAPVDALIQEANDAFGRMIDRENIINRKATEVFPGLNREFFSTVDKFDQAAFEGKTMQFEQYSRELNRWFRLQVYSPMYGYFVIIVEDISERKWSQERLEESNERLRRTISGTINTIVKIVETRDPYTAGHQKRVAQLSVAIAREMGLTDEQVNGLRIAAMIHDIGKIYIPSEILSKPGLLSGVEKEMVKIHPQASYDILSGIEFPWPVAEIALEHQERYDGSGYPSHRTGKEILPESRILTVADVVEAMTFYRPYRPAIGIEKALEEIEKNKGKLYDPQVVDAAVRLFAEHRFAFDDEGH